MPFVRMKKCLNCSAPHEWFFEGLTLKELRAIKRLTNQTASQWAEATDAGDPDALAALIYVLHKRIKIEIPWDDVDLDFNDFEMEETESEKAERETMEKEMAKKERQQTAMRNRSGQTAKVG